MGRKWQKEHPELMREAEARRRAAKRQAANDRLPEDLAAAAEAVASAVRFRESIRYGHVRRREDRNPSIQAHLDEITSAGAPVRSASGRVVYGLVPADLVPWVRSLAREMRREKASLRRMRV